MKIMLMMLASGLAFAGFGADGCKAETSEWISVKDAPVVDQATRKRERAAKVLPTMETEVLVVGGTVKGVKRAIAERKRGKRVYLLTPFAYLGEDMAGTLELGFGQPPAADDELLQQCWRGETDQAPYDYWAEPAMSKFPIWIFRNDHLERFSEPSVPPSASDVVLYDDDAKIRCVLRKPSKISEAEVLVAVCEEYQRSENGVIKSRSDTGKVIGVITEGERKGEEVVFERKGEVFELAGNHNGGNAKAVSYVAKIGSELKEINIVISKAPDAQTHMLSRIWFHLEGAERVFGVPSPLKVKRTLDRALVDAGVEFITSTAVTALIHDQKGKLVGVRAANRNGETEYRAVEVIDATRYGTLEAMARGGFAVGEEETFSRIVIADIPPEAPGMKVETLPGEMKVAHTHAVGKIYRCTFTLPMKDGTPASFAEAEWKARELTWTNTMLDDADMLVWHRKEDAGLRAAKSRSADDRYDVVVIGGGTAGSPAAISSGRTGAKTLLVEYLNVLGGTGTDGMILGYYDGNHCGFTQEFKAHNRRNGAKYSLYPRAETWRRLNREAGVEVRLLTMGVGAIREGDRVVGVRLASEFGPSEVRAKAIVDGTGNSDIAAFAGAETEFLSPGEFALQSSGQAPHRLGRGCINSDFGYLDDSSAWDLWLFGIRARAGAPDSWDIAKMPDSRERRRIVPDILLTGPDIAANRIFPDTVVQALSRQDCHGYIKDLFGFVAEDSAEEVVINNQRRARFSANIPLRSLLPRGLGGIAVIGLGVGCERDVVPIVRMQADLMNMGYSVGMAASMAAKTTGGDFRRIDLAELKRKLVERGILRREVLDWTQDTDETGDGRIAWAVKEMENDFRGSHVIWRRENRDRALPLLRDAYRKAKSDKARQIYAVTLGLLGDNAGVDTLLDIVTGKVKVVKTRKGGNLGSSGQGGDVINGFLIALGKTRDPRALPILVRRLEGIDRNSKLSAIRGITLALEAFGRQSAAPALAKALAKPGIAGFAVRDWRTLPPQGGYGVGPEMQRCLIEIGFARALWACGDYNGIAKSTLEAYAADPRDALARHAKAILLAH